MIGVTTERLVFRPISTRYTAELFAMENDPAVMQFINGGRMVAWDGYEEKISGWIGHLNALPPDFTFWAAHQRSDDVFLGWFHLKEHSRFGQGAELGYRLKKEFWNRGYATEGSRAILQRAFANGKVPLICAHTLERNSASRRVMEKVGMHAAEFFVYPEELLPFWNAENRHAVRYEISHTTVPLIS